LAHEVLNPVDKPAMSPRAFPLLATLLALFIIPATAGAAVKPVTLAFGSGNYKVSEANRVFNVTVVRTGDTQSPVTVDYALDTGTTGTPGTDWSFTPGTLSFAAGETTKTIPLTIIDNPDYNPPNKKVVIKLLHAVSSAPTQLGGHTTVTIIDNDGGGTIDLSQPSYRVVENAGVATITVTRDTTQSIVETVKYQTQALPAGAGHAVAGVDYTTASGTITFGTGEYVKTFSVPILDDQAFEGDEVLNVKLSGPKNLTNGTQPPTLGPNANGTLTIADDDVPVFGFSQPTYVADENGGPATITVTRTGATYVAADVAYSDDGTGSATGGGADYTLAPGTLHFAAGETSKTFQVAINNDNLNEGNETVGLRLKLNGTKVANALLSIVDNDSPLPSIQFSDVSYTVGEAATTADVTVTLSHASESTVTVDYATADDTATAGTTATDGSADYVDTHGTLTFDPGFVSKTISVPLNSDAVAEDDEDFTISLSNPNASALLGAPGTATVDIVDNDLVGLFEFDGIRYDVSETSGHATITVNRTEGTLGPATVDYATSDGSATAPDDYTATSGTLSFADGESSKTFEIPITWDGIAEGDETLNIALTDPTNGADLGPDSGAVLHIADDGVSAPVAFSAASYDVAETVGDATIAVNRLGAKLGGPVTVDYAGSDGSSGTLTFGPGEATKSFQVPVADDSVHTGTRTVTFTLSNPGGGTSVGDPATAALNIADDEPASAPSSNPPSDTPPSDQVAPKLAITAKKLQKALKAKRFVLKVRSSEAARLSIALKVRKSRKSKKLVSDAKASRNVAAGQTVTIKIKLNKQAIAKLRKVLAKGKVKVTFTVTGVDAAGNTAHVTKATTIR
jgi:hypothetical protein